MNKLQQHLQVIGTDKLRLIYSAMIDAGLQLEYKQNHKAIFKRLRRESKGRTKKIFAAFCHASDDEVDRMVRVITQGK